MRILVTGAGGFIGNHLVSFLREQGYWVRGIDVKYPEFGVSCADEFYLLDLRYQENAIAATEGINQVYALAADMGGVGFISKNHATILRNNSLINLNTIEAARLNKVKRYLFTSSACVYPVFKQMNSNCNPLQETDAYPAWPEDAYGWEKLITERLCTYYQQEFNLDIRIVRFHNIFGPLGTWKGGREKAPAALCRKIAYARLTRNYEIEIWGDGEQTRSFCYIDDCLVGLYKLMQSNYTLPINLGQDRMISINQLADIIAEIAGIQITKHYVKEPQGVRGRNSDNTLLRQILNWEPEISLEEGLKRTYDWIERQVSISCSQFNEMVNV